MNWKYEPGTHIEWQGINLRKGPAGYVTAHTAGYVISHLRATEELSDPRHRLGVEYARTAQEILSSLGFDRDLEYFLSKMTISAYSRRNRYLVWVPSKTGRSGNFQCPTKQAVERQEKE